MAAKTVTLTHPDAAKPVQVPEDLADAYKLAGWSEAENSSKSSSK